MLSIRPLDAPTGRYWFNGRRVDQLSGEKARSNVDVGLIFQSFNLIGDMTVLRRRIPYLHAWRARG
jgi:ABC-type lipoprotein export system ATPase subunit